MGHVHVNRPNIRDEHRDLLGLLRKPLGMSKWLGWLRFTGPAHRRSYLLFRRPPYDLIISV